MSIVLSIAKVIWPFFKEMVLGNKGIGDFLLEHKWVFINLAATMILFLLFINQYMINVQTQINVIEDDRKVKIEIYELRNANDRQQELIVLKDVALSKLNLELVTLSRSCKPNLPYPKNTGRTSTPIPVVAPPSSSDLVDKTNIDRLERLRIQSNRFNGG